MPTEVANPAKGTIIQYGTPYASPVYTTILLLIKLDGPGREVGTRETTVLTSASKTFAPTITDGGEVKGTVLYDPKGTSHALLETITATPVLGKWKITFADATNGPTTFAFDGILTGFSPNGIEVEKNLEAEFKIKVSGTVTVS